MKRTGAATTPLRKGERLQDKIEAQLARIKNAPSLVRSFFRAPSVAYYRLVSKKVAKAVGVGNGTVSRIKAEMAATARQQTSATA